jgi:hypothetical protein
MSLQVNLLKKTERRFQGIVSMKIIVLGSVGLLVSITILVLLLAGISKMTLNSDLERARGEWNMLAPQEAAVRQIQAAAEANRKTLAMLESWKGGDCPPMYSVLRAVQKNVSAGMALQHLSAGLAQGSDKEIPSIVFRISGTAKGELTAVETKRQLNSDKTLHRFCGEVRLVSSQRDSGEVWAFAIEGSRAAGGAR